PIPAARTLRKVTSMVALRNSRITNGLPIQAAILPFEPHPWFPGKHAQTILGRYWGSLNLPLPATRAEITLPDGDRLLVLDSLPKRWLPPQPAAVIVHGLAGDAEAPYVVRLARRLLRRGVRVTRVNLRGAGAGFGLARGIYHAGRSDDLREIMKWL